MNYIAIPCESVYKSQLSTSYVHNSLFQKLFAKVLLDQNTARPAWSSCLAQEMEI